MAIEVGRQQIRAVPAATPIRFTDTSSLLLANSPASYCCLSSRRCLADDPFLDVCLQGAEGLRVETQPFVAVIFLIYD